MVNASQLNEGYQLVKSSCQMDWSSDTASKAILDLAVTSVKFLSENCNQVTLTSKVPGKSYISFSLDGIVLRPANKAYFTIDSAVLSKHWRSNSFDQIGMATFRKAIYSIALAPCLAFELLDRNNKKGPATYFEHMIGHIFSKMLGVKPTKGTSFKIGDQQVKMTMDFLFEMESLAPNIHLPVKMSTRERVVQAWAHQRLLESFYGVGSYKGVMVVFSETKLDAKKLEVVEICVPDQWLAYQSLLTKIEDIYYFDMPVRYRELGEKHPKIFKLNSFYDYFAQK